MQHFHTLTNITLKKFYSEPTFIDYRTQPKDHKQYPTFFQRFSLEDHEALGFLKNIGKVTDSKTYGKEQIHLRANASAGGLYPCEVYIQIRGIKGVLSGLYHYEPLHNSITLLQELNEDGLEGFYTNKKVQHHFVFLVSVAYFRTAWKYDKRSIRYLLLDVGHQLGTIYTALKQNNMPVQFDFEFDKQALNELLSFEDFEFFLCSVTSGTHKEKATKPMQYKIAHVSACDYQLRDETIEEFYAKSLEHSHENFDFFDFFDDISTQQLQTAIDTRRSIRAFKQESIALEDFYFICEDIFHFAQTLGIEIYYVNHNIEQLQAGLYKNVTLLKEGHFQRLSTKLSLNQKLGGNSAATLFYTAKPNNDYVQTSIYVGFLAHIISIKATIKNIHSSGIGAYFDDEIQTFLQSDNNILYLQAIGR